MATLPLRALGFEAPGRAQTERTGVFRLREADLSWCECRLTAAAQERLDANVVMRTYVILLPALSLAYVHRALFGVSQTWPVRGHFYAVLSAGREACPQQ